jgi:hypothetical protein
MMFATENYIKHSDENPEILPEDFTNDPDLLEKVEKTGELNNVRYKVSTGCIVDPSGVKGNDEIIEVEFVGDDNNN